MAKTKHREVKFTAKEMADDVPSELDFRKLKFVGRGKEAIFRKREAGKAVTLDQDVAAVFTDSKAVNEVLRTLIEIANKASGPARQTVRQRRTG